MGKVTRITIFNQKGGVGKTTTAKAIAGELVKNHNKKVLLVDCDCSCNLTNGIIHNGDNSTTLAELVLNYCNDDEEGYIGDAICTTPIENLHLVPGIRDYMLTAERTMVNAAFNSNAILDTMLCEVEDEYDFIICDVGAGEKNKWCNNALVYSDYVLSPIQASVDSFTGYNNVVSTIKTMRKDNRKLKLLGVFFTSFRANVNTAKEALAAASEIGDVFIPVQIRFSAAVENARTEQLPLCYAEPKAKPTLDYADLVNCILDRLEV